jgi:hypothetical protein
VGPIAGLDALAKEKNSQPLPGLEPPIIQPVAHRYTTELSRLYSFKVLLLLLLLIIIIYYPKSRDSSVGIALGYGLDDRGSRVRLPAGAGNFSLHHRSGAHRASYPMGTRGSFPGGKAAGT